MHYEKGQLSGYIRLAAAIVNLGIADQDEQFLKSEWCQELADAVVSYHNMDSTAGLKAFNLQNRIVY